MLARIDSVAWITLAIFAFGISDGVAILIVFISVVFTLKLGTVNNMHNVEQLYIDTARVLGANRRQVIQHVIFPAILPNLFVIMRINVFVAWMRVLAAEMVGVRTGMGAIVVAGRQMMNMNLTFLGMAMIGLVGYLLDASFRPDSETRPVVEEQRSTLVMRCALPEGVKVRKRRYCQSRAITLTLSRREREHHQWTSGERPWEKSWYRFTKVWGADTPQR